MAIVIEDTHIQINCHCGVCYEDFDVTDYDSNSTHEAKEKALGAECPNCLLLKGLDG